MAEYIEREAVIAKYKQYLAELDGVDNEFAISVMRNEPAADVVEVRHGQWEEADDGDGVVCSICREDFCSIIHEVDRFRICPNCGARMGDS